MYGIQAFGYSRIRESNLFTRCYQCYYKFRRLVVNWQSANGKENVGSLGNVSSGLKHIDASGIETATDITTLYAAIDRLTTRLR